MGAQEKRTDSKTRKSRRERKVVGFSSASHKDTGGSHPGWNKGDRPPSAEEKHLTRGIDNLTWRRTRESVSSKAGKTSETACAFQVHSRKTRITRA